MLERNLHQQRLFPYPWDQVLSRLQMSSRLPVQPLKVTKFGNRNILCISLIICGQGREVVPPGSTSRASLIASEVAISWFAGEIAKIREFGCIEQHFEVKLESNRNRQNIMTCNSIILEYRYDAETGTQAMPDKCLWLNRVMTWENRGWTNLFHIWPNHVINIFDDAVWLSLWIFHKTSLLVTMLNFTWMQSILDG